MTESYKVLGQTVLGSKALNNVTYKENVIYKVPEGKQASISSLTITNTSSENKTYSLSLVPSNETASSYFQVSYNYLDGSVGPTRFGSYSTDIYTTSNGESWNQHLSRLQTGIKKAVVFKGKTYAVGNNLELYVSQDHLTWSKVDLYYGIVDILVNQDTLLLYTNTNYNFLYTTNGVNWLSGGFPYYMYANPRIIYFNNKYLALSSYSSYYSEDLVTWTQFSAVPFSYYDNLKLMKFNSVLTLIDSSRNKYTSYDGINWYTEAVNYEIYYSNMVNGIGVMRGQKLIEGVFAGPVSLYTENGIDLIELPIEFSLSGPFICYYFNKKYYWLNGYGNYYVCGPSISDIISTGPNIPVSGQVLLDGVGPVVSQGLQSIPNSQSRHQIFYNKTIKPGVTHEVYGGVGLSSGDEVRALSQSNEIIANVYGVEII